MRVLITGAAGMLGRRLTRRILADGRCAGGDVEALDLIDVTDPVDAAGSGPTPPTSGPVVTARTGDLADPELVRRILDSGPDLVFHLAGVVSGEAERDRHKGYRVNLDGTRLLLDALADGPGRPRVVFASSIAVFGAPLPDPVTDDVHPTPLTSYGTQKAMAELLLADHTRRGLVDGVAIRLPTITVRPGSPNAAASGFFSSIIREPLAGLDARLPVDPSVRHPHASPRSAVGYLLHAAALGADGVGAHPVVTMPSLSVTVAEQIEALRRVAGDEAAARIHRRDDPEVAAIVAGWPRRFATDRADALGFRCETSYDQIIRTHLDEVAGPVRT